MIISVLLAIAAAPESGATPSVGPGKAIYESAAASECKAFYKPGEPMLPRPPEPQPLERREPYTGENMLQPIAPLDAQGLPPAPTHRSMKLPEALKGPGIAKGIAIINPQGKVVRVETSSKSDARLAAFFAANVAMWEYRPLPDDPRCRRHQIEFEVKVE